MSGVNLKNDLYQFFILESLLISNIVIELPFLSIRPSSLKSDSVRLTVSVAIPAIAARSSLDILKVSPSLVC